MEGVRGVGVGLEAAPFLCTGKTRLGMLNGISGCSIYPGQNELLG